MPKKNQKPEHLSKPSQNQVRIIGGSMRGRKIRFVDGEGLRPTLDRIRETVFNWLAADISGANCLDLFAGSGALGFEALSRGARSVALVDSSKQVTQSLSKNIATLGIVNAQLSNLFADQYLRQNTEKFDVVFLDPPFGKMLLESVLDQLKPHLASNALVYVEQENEQSAYAFRNEWDLVKSKKTSTFLYDLIRLK